MRLRELFGLLAAFCLSGCAGSDGSGRDNLLSPENPGRWNWGGQTGSLVPACGPSPEPVPEGASGIVVGTSGCGGLPRAADVQLTDEAGEVIETEWIPLGNGRYLLRPSRLLERGQYRLSIAGTSQAVRVGSSSPKPLSLGSLELRGSALCDLNAELVIDDAVLPYAPLLRIGVELDGVERLHSEHGGLTLTGKALEVRCAACLGSGQHELQASGELAGETSVLLTAALSFSSACPAESHEGDASMVGCGFSGAQGGGGRGVWSGVTLGLFALLRVGRARKSGGS
jgi:hypothetical protein